MDFPSLRDSAAWFSASCCFVDLPDLCRLHVLWDTPGMKRGINLTWNSMRNTQPSLPKKKKRLVLFSSKAIKPLDLHVELITARLQPSFVSSTQAVMGSDVKVNQSAAETKYHRFSWPHLDHRVLKITQIAPLFHSRLCSRGSKCIPIQLLVNICLQKQKKPKEKQKKAIFITAKCCVSVNNLICSFTAPFWWQKSLHMILNKWQVECILHRNRRDSLIFSHFTAFLASFQHFKDILMTTDDWNLIKSATASCFLALFYRFGVCNSASEAFLHVFSCYSHTEQQICSRQWQCVW